MSRLSTPKDMPDGGALLPGRREYFDGFDVDLTAYARFLTGGGGGSCAALAAACSFCAAAIFFSFLVNAGPGCERLRSAVVGAFLTTPLGLALAGLALCDVTVAAAALMMVAALVGGAASITSEWSNCIVDV